MDKVALGQAFFPPNAPVCTVRVSIIPPVFHTHLHLRVSHTGRKHGRIMGNYEKATLLQEFGSVR